MRLRNRPLLVDGIDSELYVARPALERSLLDALAAERNLLLVGAAGSGKTTVLRSVASRLTRRVIWVNASLAQDATELLELVSREFGPGPAQPSPTLLDALDAIPSAPAAVIIVDGVLDAAAAYDAFGRLRDQLWSLPHTWVAAVTPDRSAPLRTPPADAFWSVVVQMPLLTVEEIKELLDRGLSDDELDRLKEHLPPARETPRRVVQFAQNILDGTWEPSRTQERWARVEGLGRPAQVALAEIEAINRPVSANDPELLQRIGWTRPYAARVLADLERRGVLRSISDGTRNQGRPRKLYELDPEI